MNSTINGAFMNSQSDFNNITSITNDKNRPPKPRLLRTFVVKQKNIRSTPYKIHQTKDMLFSTQPGFFHSSSSKTINQQYNQQVIATMTLRNTLITTPTNKFNPHSPSKITPFNLEKRQFTRSVDKRTEDQQYKFGDSMSQNKNNEKALRVSISASAERNDGREFQSKNLLFQTQSRLLNNKSNTLAIEKNPKSMMSQTQSKLNIQNPRQKQLQRGSSSLLEYDVSPSLGTMTQHGGKSVQTVNTADKQDTKQQSSQYHLKLLKQTVNQQQEDEFQSNILAGKRLIKAKTKMLSEDFSQISGSGKPPTAPSTSQNLLKTQKLINQKISKNMMTSTFMITTVTNKIKQLIRNEEIAIKNKEQEKSNYFKLDLRSAQKQQIDKLMRLKDELKIKGLNNSSVSGNVKHFGDKPRQIRFGSVAYLIQKPRSNSEGETKKSQIDLLTRDLKSLMQEVKDETKMIKEKEEKRQKQMRRFWMSGRSKLSDVSESNIKECDSDKENDNKKGNKNQNQQTQQPPEQEEEIGLNREEFGRLLIKVGLGADTVLIDKIFWIFDEDGSGDIDHKELGVGLELLKNNTFEEKLDKFFDLCDEDNSGTIDKKEFYTLLRLNVTDYEDRNRLKTYVNEIFQQFDKRGNGDLTKEEMKEACSSNPKIKNLIEKNVKILKDIDNWIESDFARPFTTKISFCAGLKERVDLQRCSRYSKEL
eukprot:403366069